MYDKLSESQSLIWESEITEHCCIEKDFFKVTYSNGVEVYINYSDTEKTDNGITVGAFNYAVKGA